MTTKSELVEKQVSENLKTEDLEVSNGNDIGDKVNDKFESIVATEKLFKGLVISASLLAIFLIGMMFVVKDNLIIHLAILLGFTGALLLTAFLIYPGI